MKTTTCTMIAAAAVLLASCQGSAEPAAPPTSQDALTTAADAAPTTAAGPDEGAETSAPKPAEVTSEAGGAPEMPDEAKEDSESGAEAFALHYVDLLNYTSRYPEVGLLEPLGADGCKSCANHEDSVEYMAKHSETMERDGLEVLDSISLHEQATSVATVRIHTQQVEQSVLGPDGKSKETIPAMEATMVFDLSWGDEWSIREIRVDQGKQ